MTDVPSKFTGYAAQNEQDGKAFKVAPWEYEPPKWNERCVDIKVSACGVCGSCVHTITSGWGASKYPCIVGHEIVGTVVRAGKDSGHKVGARVGVGAQCGSCEECDKCKSGQENLCPKMCGTYQGSWGDDYTKGGYANYFRSTGRFAIPIPDELTDENAAPMMCGGVTVYTPLVENGAGPGKKVGIVGIGGLGHYGLMFANALGAEVYAISHSHDKEQLVYEKMGVKKGNFIATGDGVEKAAKDYPNFFDLIIVTSNQDKPPIEKLFVPIMAPRAQLIFVGMTEGTLGELKAQSFAMKMIKIGGSLIGSPQQLKDMLALAVKHNVQSITQVRPMSETGQALSDLDQGKARFRYVLKN